MSTNQREANRAYQRAFKARRPERYKELRREAARRYRERNRERTREVVRAVRARNKGRYVEQARRWRQGRPAESRRPKSDVLARVSPISAHYMPARGL